MMGITFESNMSGEIFIFEDFKMQGVLMCFEGEENPFDDDDDFEDSFETKEVDDWRFWEYHNGEYRETGIEGYSNEDDCRRAAISYFRNCADRERTD